MGFGGVVGWKEAHREQMGVQEEDECRRQGVEIQSSDGSKRLLPSAGN